MSKYLLLQFCNFRLKIQSNKGLSALKFLLQPASTFLVVIFVLTSSRAYSQVEFEQGYIVYSNGKRVECYIKNTDILRTPNQIEYKETADSETTIKGDPKLIQEFGFRNYPIKFISALVQIDQSEMSLSKASEDSEPEFEQKRVFLQAVIIGKASLFEFRDQNASRFFFSVDDSNIEQLVFKPYKVVGQGMAYNRKYKTQILKKMYCDAITSDRLKTLNYSNSHLKKVFQEYNEFQQADFIVFTRSSSKGFFEISLRPGWNFSTLEMKDLSEVGSIDLSSDFSDNGFRIGIALEYFLAFNKNKWSILFEPTYVQFSSSNQLNTGSLVLGDAIIQVDYRSIEIPLGVRYNMYNSKNWKSFLNASFIFDASQDNPIEIETLGSPNGNQRINIDSGQNFAFGAGAEFKNSFSFEMRLYTSRSLTQQELVWDTNLSTYSFILGYRFLQN